MSAHLVFDLETIPDATGLRQAWSIGESAGSAKVSRSADSADSAESAESSGPAGSPDSAEAGGRVEPLDDAAVIDIALALHRTYAQCSSRRSSLRQAMLGEVRSYLPVDSDTDTGGISLAHCGICLGEQGEHVSWCPDA